MKAKRTSSAVYRCLILWVSVLSLSWIEPTCAAGTVAPAEAKQSVTVGVVREGWPPLLILRDEQLSGASFDILRAALGAGITYNVRVYPDLPTLAEAACAGQFDVMLARQGPAAGTGCLQTTNPYYDADTVLIGRTADLTADGSLHPRPRIALDAGSHFDVSSRDRYPDATFLRVSNTTEGLRAVANGSADYYVTLQPVAEYQLSQAEFASLSEAAHYRDANSSISFAVTSSAAMLGRRLNVGLANMPEATRVEIFARWMTAGRIRQEQDRQFLLTLEERAYLRSLPALRVNLDPGLAPYSYLDDSGEPTGIAVDYLAYLEETLGITFNRQPPSRFATAIESLRNGSLDIIAVVLPNDPALGAVPASRPYAVFPIAIIGKQATPTVAGLADLKAARIAVTDGGGIRSLVQQVLPRANVVVLPGIRAGMEAVKNGQADVYVDDLAAANFELLRNYGDLLRIIGSDAIQVQTALAIRPDLAERLMPLINRALAAMPEQRRLAIQHRYITATYSFGYSLGAALLRSAPLILGLLCVVGILMRSRQLLRKEAAVRRAAEHRLQEITGSIPAIVYQCRRPAGSTAQFEFTYAAGNGESSLGIAPRDLLESKLSLERVVDPRYQALVRAKLSEPVNSDLPVELDYLIHGALGPRWIRVRAVTRIESGYVIRTGVVSDVSEQHRQAEALAEATTAAEAALRAKESFLAMMSHEIRTPLNGVLGLLEVLHSTRLDTEQRRLLSLVVESGQSLAQILDDVLDYAKMEAGKLAILPTPTDLRDLADSVLGLLAPQANNKGIQLRIHIAPQVPATISADAIRLRQILFNLLGNAIKFTDHGNVILRIYIEAVHGEDADLAIQVADTGIGISPENLQRLFSPFVQSDHSSTRSYGGTGLGLSICKRLASLMNGELTMQSEPGEGTTVTLRIICPVLCTSYDLPAFKGRLVMVSVRDAPSAACLRAYAQAAGLVSLDDPPAAGTPYSHLYDGDLPPGVPCKYAIQVTNTPKQLGFAVVGGTVRLSQNPLRWSAFLGALKESIRAADPAASPAFAIPGNDGIAQSIVTHAPQKQVRVLVAEDHPINRELIRQQLDLLGYPCSLCKDGHEALQALLREPFDLVLTDCHMPVMDGFDLARAIRASTDERVRGLRIVGVTATTLAEEHQRCFDVGMSAYVLKPTTLASLQKALDGSLASQPGVTGIVVDGEAPGPIEPLAAALTFDPRRVSRETLLGGLGSGLWTDAMLATCRESIHADRDGLARELVANGEPSVGRLREWCHRAGGAMAMFQVPYIDQLFDGFSAIVKRGDKEQILAAGASMLAMLSYLASLISVPGETAAAPAAGPEMNAPERR
ncbi:ATP-binding protein [Cupriavidus numazuensis]|uniref:histidine kinase n=1 Tax=Cupriavidus numazuensis TaxID=221992 RepID=A0ABM8TP63_9BURK|nr:transporter substrate-binding domain-containing protein [Cupriavidus numazuensis]CAG2156831.1 Sensor histidine kinase RcsC [Cupriavidus numazuensis]